MNYRQCIALMLCVVCAVILTVAAGANAQPKDRTDMTGHSDLTPENIVYGLTPKRGVKEVIVPGGQPLPTLAIDVVFATNSAAISQASLKNLNSIGEALKAPELAGSRIQIEAHTDSRGSDQLNMKLSQRRANSVKDYLVSRYHIAPERLVAGGRGESEPIADNNTPEGRQKNRRVELVNLAPQS
jgi:outer membrane protein OmpA-like peptidoglycan-associated protein